MNTAHLLISSYDPFLPRSGNDNKWAHTARTRVPQGTSEHSQALEGSRLSPRREPSEGNNSPSSSLLTDLSPSGWLAAESLKGPFPPSQLRTRVRNCVTHCFLRRTSLHCCRGPGAGSWLPRPGRSPGAHGPEPCGWLLPEGFGPAHCGQPAVRGGWKGKARSPRAPPSSQQRSGAFPPELLPPLGLPGIWPPCQHHLQAQHGPLRGRSGAGSRSPKYKWEGHNDSVLAYMVETAPSPTFRLTALTCVAFGNPSPHVSNKNSTCSMTNLLS